MLNNTLPHTTEPRQSAPIDADASWKAYLDAADELDAPYMPTYAGMSAAHVRTILTLIATGGLSIVGFKAIAFLQTGVW